MTSEQFRLRLNSRKLLLQNGRDATVQLLTARSQKGAVGGVLDQSVLEAVGRIWRDAAAKEQLGSDQLV